MCPSATAITLSLALGIGVMSRLGSSTMRVSGKCLTARPPSNAERVVPARPGRLFFRPDLTVAVFASYRPTVSATGVPCVSIRPGRTDCATTRPRCFVPSFGCLTVPSRH